jgi:D-arabinose 1-dehydrogenase-like Zn-dependent alcohol dehydrogenase
MRSYQIIDWGQPLERRERPTPVPIGSQVLLRTTAAGICHTDLHIKDGYFDLGDGKKAELAKLGAQLPLTLGHEIVGVVEALGPDAKGVAVGDARIAFPWIGCRHCGICVHEREQWCATPKFLGARVDGGYSDHVLVPDPRYLVPFDGIPAELACTYACAGLTAYSAIRKLGQLREEDTLVLIGAGGVGQSALQMAPALTPARLLVADIDPAKRALAEAAGVASIDNGAPDAVAEVLARTGGGARAAIDFVGAPATTHFGLSVLRKGGHHIVVGLFGGSLSYPLPFIPSRSLTIEGSYVGTLEELKAVVALGQAGKIEPIPLDLRPLDATPAALDDLRAGRVTGRVVLQPQAA